MSDESKINDGGPAFPQEWSTFKQEGDPAYVRATRVYNHRHGLSMRDWFAGQALTFWARMQIGGWVGDFPQQTAEHIAKHCYMMADAMLKERTKEPTP